MVAELVSPHYRKARSQFAAWRQRFQSIVLANWLKNSLASMPDVAKEIGPAVNSMRPTEYHRPHLYGITPVRGEWEDPTEPSMRKPVDNINPNDAGFRIPENRYYYEQYMRLYRDGVFGVVRDGIGGPGRRAYFSGEIDLRRIPVTVVTS